ncbi:hypothetical protein quinque_007816 [Culex quinquefasciatus]
MTYGCGKTTALLAGLVLTTFLHLATAETYECTIGKLEYGEGEFCIFRNVSYSAKSTASIGFKTPGNSVQTRIAFEESELDHLPKEFLSKFGKDMRVLHVVRCKLQSVVITNAMEELFATDNYIEKVIVHQQSGSSPIKSIHLQSNRLEDVSNITRNCKNVTILDLSRNELLSKESVINLGMFNGLNQLEYLLLADVGALYLDYDNLPNLPSLTLLDLSMNNLLPSDLQVDKLSVLENLRVLRFNDIGFAQLDYAHLTQMKSLKQVYLEGNSFDCVYLVDMINFLNEKGIETPVARPATVCSTGFKVEKQMCCKSSDLGVPIKTTKPITTHGSTHKPASELNEVYTSKTTETMPTMKTTGSAEMKPKTSSGNGVSKVTINFSCILVGLALAKLSSF